MGQNGSRHKRLQPQLVIEEKERGVPTDKEELFAWRSTNVFTLLSPRGQEAFFKYLRGDSYPEDKDIIDIDVRAEGMNGNSRRYQFWLKTKGMDLSNLFDVYVFDLETNVADVMTCFTKFKSQEEKSEYIKEKASDAKKVDGFVNELKDMMKPELDRLFTNEFMKSLEDVYGKNGENIK